jgi:hypothetical protein
MANLTLAPDDDSDFPPACTLGPSPSPGIANLDPSTVQRLRVHITPRKRRFGFRFPWPTVDAAIEINGENIKNLAKSQDREGQ